MIHDKLQPHAGEIEQKVLGGILIYHDTESFEIASSIITGEMFYVPKHKIIFKAMESLSKNKKQIDKITVSEELKNSGLINDVGYSFLASIGGADAIQTSPANIEVHCRYIQQYYIKRETIKFATALIDQSFEPTYDVFELGDNVRRLDNFFSDQFTGSNQFQQLSKLVDQERIRYNEKLAAKEKGLPLGITTGFRELNQISNGWQKGNLIVVGARPAMGKTGLMLAFAIAAARTGTPVYIPTLEMTPDELTERILISESEVNSEKYKSGNLSQDEIVITDDTRTKIRNMGIYIDDTPAITTTRLKALCRKFCKEHPNGIVMVDYLQKMKSGNPKEKFREAIISECAQELKNIARENKIPVIALSQLNRDVEKRDNKRPTLADLRESGAIEQEADVVIFIHRPEYYDANDSVGIAELIIAKYRNGRTGMMEVNFIGELIKFTDKPQQYNVLSGIKPNTDFTTSKKESDDPPF